MRWKPISIRTALAALAIAGVSAGEAGAQVIDFDDLAGSPNYAPVPISYGSTSKVAVTNRTRLTFGNAGSPDCNGTPRVLYWDYDYSNLQHVGFACSDGAVGEFFFDPAGGQRVFLNSLQLGSWDSQGGSAGPVRSYSLFVYDASDWTTPVFSSTGTVSTALTINPNVSSTAGLYLQWGTDWSVGIDNINFAARPIEGVPSVAPEPATMALLGTGLAGLAGAARRRRREPKQDA